MDNKTNCNQFSPSRSLVEKWVAEIWHEGTSVKVAASDLHIAERAAQWGDDQRLEACVEWLRANGLFETRIGHLRAAMRPKPPSLAEQGLEALGWPPVPGNFNIVESREYATIRAALKRLKELEGQQRTSSHENNDTAG